MLPVLQIRNLGIDFVNGGNITHAVKNVSLDIKRGEIMALVGESGSGKSVTALSILQLLPTPPANYVSGSILLSEDGTTQSNLLTTTAANLQHIRGNRIGMIFQEPMSSLNPIMTCGAQVVEAIKAHENVSAKEARQTAIDWFGRLTLPMPEDIFKKYPHQLSGGQKQRVMIAMAMCCHPSLLVCDEPTTALDVTVQRNILNQISQLREQANMGVLFITHDLGIVSDIANRVAIMYKGEIVEENDKESIFKNARHPYTRALIACRPTVNFKGNRLPVIADFMEEVKTKKQETIENPNRAVNNPAKELMRIQDLSVTYTVKRNLLGRAAKTFKAVDRVNFSIYEGETLGLVGESGCGKTTLGRTLLRLIEPSAGSIFYKGVNVLDAAGKGIKKLRKEVQLVFQDPYSSLNPTLTIGRAIEEPIRVLGLEEQRKKRKMRVDALVGQVQLSKEMENRYPHEFSGGQRQRIVIARALALNPGLLICDESVSALDVSVQAQVLNLLNDLKKELGLTMLFISHDLSVIRYMCDRVMVMQAGQIIEAGTADEIYTHPKNAYTKKLLDAVPELTLS